MANSSGKSRNSKSNNRSVGMILAAFIACALAAPEARAAAPADFAKKMTLTPSTSALAKIGETAWTDFPVLVRLPAEVSSQLQAADGTDLYVEDENKVPLAFEVESFDSAGTTLVWVKVPSLSSATKLTAYFGGAANADNDPTAVWSRYVGVWHYAPDAAGTTTVVDATGHSLAGTTTGTISTYAGPFGGDTLQCTEKINAPDYDSLLSNVAQFSVSGWFKAPNQSSAYYTFASKKADLNWSADQGWYLEMSQSKTKANLVLTDSNNFNIPDVSANWNYFHLVSDGSTIKVYMNGSTSAAVSKSYKVKASSKVFLICGKGGCSDEYRVRAGAASAAETALEYATMADTAFFDLGAIESVDDTAQVFETPTIVRNDNGTYTVTVVLRENNGDVGAIYDAGATAVTNILATAATPGTFTDTPANLTADTTYKFAAYGKNTNGTEVVAKGGVFCNGDLSIEKISDAVENGLVPGVFRISRADTAHDLVVAYTVGGTAIAGQTYETLSGTATILAGSNSVDIAVTPLLDAQTTSDTTVSVTLAAGFYGIDAQAGAAELTIANLVAPSGYNTWIATAPGLASVGSNWSEGHAPLATENVLFDGRFSKANCDWDADATATVASWTQTNGYTGVITLKTVYPGKGDFQCLTVTGPMAVMSGTITHPQSRTMGDNHPATWDWLGDLLANETYRLRLAVGSLTVGAGGLLDAKGKGYRVTNNSAMVNASHGGRASQAAQRCYGDPKEPIHIGLADKTQGDGGYYNGKGGGAIYVTSAGPVVVDGTIRADSDREGTGCCGAAGSVYLNASSVSGTGTISAYGPGSGDGNNKGTGGRVAIVTDDPVDRTTFASITADSARLHSANRRATRFGGAGTVFFQDRTRPNGLLVVGSSTDALSPTWNQIYATASVTTDGDWTFDAVEFGRFGFLVVPAGTRLTLPNGLASCTGVVASASAVGGIRYEGGTLDVGSDAQTIAGNWMFCAWSNYVFHADVTVKNGGLIGVHPVADILDNNAANLPAFVSCNLTVNGNLTVESDGKLLAKSCGLKKDKNSINSGFSGVLPGHTHGGRCLSYKGIDAQLRFYTGYDSVFAPCLPGNSVPWPNGQAAEESGGVIRLVVTGALTLDGEANANGMLETYAAGGNCSGGTGGSIDITAGTISGTGRIVAEAGSKQAVRGSAGRIAVKLTSPGADFSSFSGTISASGRVLGSGGPADSSAGTVYLQTAADGEKGGTVYIAMSAGNQAANNTNTTEMVSLGYGGDAVDDYKKVKYVVRDYGRAAVNANMKAASIEIADANSSLDLEGHALKTKAFRYPKTGGGLAKLSPGTYTAERLRGMEITCVVDTSDGASGSLVVTGGGFSLKVR